MGNIVVKYRYMNYVFFDVECANCLNGEGKICSFGYVKTDENFHVLKKKDILVDPDAKFLLGNAKAGKGIKLAYPLFKFKRAFTFPHYYQEIKKLLENPSNICFGFAVHQDVNYISYSCRRYNLPVIQFSFFDIQQFDKEIHHRNNASGLDFLVEQYHALSFIYHRSDDDALMSMEVFKGMVEEMNLDVISVLEQYKNCIDDTEHFLLSLREKVEKREKKKQHEKQISEFHSCNISPSLENYHFFFWKKKFFFDNAVLNEHIEEMISLKKDFMKKGGIPCRNPLASDYIVVHDLKTNDHMNLNSEKLKSGVQFITYKTFFSTLTKASKN